jgi:hypothetical protein
LHAAGLLSGDRQFDFWLIALRAGASSPADAAALAGGAPALWRPRISRSMSDPRRARLVRRVRRGEYRLTAVGARRADALVVSFRTTFRQLGQI